MYGFVPPSALVLSSRPSPAVSSFVGSRTPSNVRTASPRSASVITMAGKLDKSKIPMNLFRPNAPLAAKVVYNERIVGDDAPGETKHMIFNHDGALQYLEGQSIGIMAPGLDDKGKPHKVRLYSIASTQHGDFGDDKTISLVVKRLVYENEKGEEVKGVCSNHLCNLTPGDEVKISGPVGTAMLMPADTNATIIMLATGTGIAPFRSFMRRAFAENNPDYQFTGNMWLFLGVPTSSTLLYQEELEEMKANFPEQVRLDYAISREQTSPSGEKMYLQTRMKEYTDELYNLIQKDNTYVYMCM
jgi:ferredoxin--NADP+ reductase